MKIPRIALFWTALSCATALAAPSTLASAGTPSVAFKDRHVILISLDGFPAALWRDPALPAPTLRKLAAAGAQTEAMTVSNPSITWINHTTLVTGVSPRKHGVLFNGLLTRPEGSPPKIEQWAPKERMVRVPTLYDLAHGAGLTTAESDWVATTKAPTLHWSFPELPSPDGALEREMIAAGAFSEEKIQWMQFGPGRKNVAWLDESWTRAAQFILRQHKPNLLLFHLLNTDAVHHTYGAGTMASYTAIAYADRLVRELLQTLEETGLQARTTVVVTTDHGFKKVSKVIHPNILLKKAGFLQTAGSTVSQWDAFCMPQGGLSFVYVRDPARKAELLPRLQELFAHTEGIERVLDGSEGPPLGMPTPAENPGMGDLVLYAKNGYAFKAGHAIEEAIPPSTGYLGTHGYPSSDPELDGICIFSGNQIRRGVVLPRISNLDVAPTLARILGLQFPETEGRVLEEFLELTR